MTAPAPTAIAPPPCLEAELDVAVGAAASRFELAARLTLARGVLVLFGPSGAGKSLALQALAGLIRSRAGFLRVGGDVLYDQTRGIDVPPHRRRIGYVPQHHALFPFRDVLDNVLFGLPRAARRRDNPRVLALMDELGIAHLADAHPGRLSGGERQRVALARALAVTPRLLLLDEPFASIDQPGRAALRATLRSVLDHRALPAVFVTHDPDEARELGDAMVLVEHGRTIATGAPDHLLDDRRRVVVTGRADVPAVRLDDGRVRLELAAATLTGPADTLGGRAGTDLRLELRAGRRSPDDVPPEEDG